MVDDHDLMIGAEQFKIDPLRFRLVFGGARRKDLENAHPGGAL